MPGQWEFQVGPCRGIEMGDHLVMSRYIMLRITESHNCVCSFSPKPKEGDWNGAGCHTNFSITPMRSEGGYECILKVCEAFGKKAAEHIKEYGEGNDKRLTGKHETCSINQFKYGVADRGASIRIPRDAEKNGRGYMEDRRPAANCDPYKVTGRIVMTTGECLEGTMEFLWPAYERKMKREKLNKAAIDAFKYNFGVLVSGASTMIGESALDPVESLTTYESLPSDLKPELLKQTVILKLNGGLGTGMGLDKAKSLLTVTEGKSFLDLIALQVQNQKKKYDVKDLKFMLMNSFSTSADTKRALAKYKDLGKGSDLEFVQNKAPKVTASDYSPADWKADRGHEWCPPGHGDLYPAMLGSGTLDKLLKKGFKYMFVSNSDNLGATMDLKILTHFAATGAPFMMEVATRTDADKKGGHLAKDKKTGGLLLRESAQCPDADEKEFQNVNKYKFFNTNNLWVDLEALKALFEKNNGAVPLPVMTNSKTVDPRDKESTKVLQLETAMGAAISSFEGAQALVIPRSRFAPVKTTNDLFALRSDAYKLTEESVIVLQDSRNGVPPNIKLDGAYKFVDAMETLIPKGPPSLINCTGLTVEGKVVFEAGVVIEGKVTIKGGSDAAKTVKAGTYKDTTVEL
jgi:UDP-N-acetylglucosamine pyrophosphorylase